MSKLSFRVRAAILAPAALILVAVTPGASASASTTTANSPSTIKPDNSGWHTNYSVGIQVNGTGSYVSTAIVGSSSGNAIPAGRTVRLTDGPTTANQYPYMSAVAPGGAFAAEFNVYTTFPNTWWLCGSISGYVGRPCVEIES